MGKLHAHFLFLGEIIRNIFIRLRLLYFGVCGCELYSGHWRTKWKIGRQSSIYRPRYLNQEYVTFKASNVKQAA